MPPNRKPEKPRVWPVPSRALLAELARAEELQELGQRAEALKVLTELSRRYRERPEPLTALSELALETEDVATAHRALELLCRLDPGNPLALGALAENYADAARPAAALQLADQFLAEWPDHELAAGMAQLRDEAAETLPESQRSPEGADELEIEADHERMLMWILADEWEEARRIGERTVRRNPEYAPAWINLGQYYYTHGQLSRAIENARRGLAVEPENPYALGNLVRYHCALGDLDRAREYAERLYAIESDHPAVLQKAIEVAGYLGDDVKTLALIDAARPLPEELLAQALVLHLGAVAALHLGNESRARELWQETLTNPDEFMDPGKILARANLDDLRAPAEKRHAPWPYFTENWVTTAAVRSLKTELSPLRGEEQEIVGRAARRVLLRHPELAGAIPLLLDRGDPAGRELALELALSTDTPEMAEALRVFAFSRRGPDDLRERALEHLRQTGQLPAGLIHVWRRGSWEDLPYLQVEILPSTPATTLHLAVMDLLRDVLARVGGEPRTADELLERAEQVAPGNAEVLSRLGDALLLRGKPAAAERHYRVVLERDPNDLVAICEMARAAVTRGDCETAKALVEPLRSQTALRSAEIRELCITEIAIEIRRDRPDRARHWVYVQELLLQP